MAKKEKEIDVRFSKFGTISFTSTTRVNDFMDRLQQGKVSGTKCKGCGNVYFPPRADCHNCFTSDMEWFDVTGKGKLLTYSKLEYAPVGFENDLPYSIALLDFSGYKVFGRIANDVPEDELKVGMEMKVSSNELPNGQLNYVFHKA
jgi:uncharacterized OB-fold protein